MSNDEYPDCAICYQPIREYDWYIQVRRQEGNPLFFRVAHHTCPPEQEN